jgi:cell division protein FtsW (lipid II flippase)
MREDMLGFLLIIGLLAYLAYRGFRALRRCVGPRERLFLVRMWGAYLVVGVGMLLGLMFSTNKARVLLLLPVIAVVLTAAKFFSKTRARLQRIDRGEVDFEQMKRAKEVR